MHRLTWMIFGWPGHWRVRLIVSAVIAAVVTPNPDALSMLIWFVPMFVVLTVAAWAVGWREGDV